MRPNDNPQMQQNNSQIPNVNKKYLKYNTQNPNNIPQQQSQQKSQNSQNQSQNQNSPFQQTSTQNNKNQNSITKNQQNDTLHQNLTPNTKNEVAEFIEKIKQILTTPHTDERTEQLGEIIFYFLHEFIPKYNLNIIPQLDDTVLCSKLTGILINEDDNEILEIVSNNETIIMFIKNVIVVR